jgi:adenylylsulfate reductase subunit A
MAADARAELIMMERRFMPARFKDGYGPVGARCLLFKTKSTNAFGEVYIETNKEPPNDFPSYGQAKVPASCLRNQTCFKRAHVDLVDKSKLFK